MLIGILSDSHDRYETVRLALARFDAAGVERIIHCGDVGGRSVFEALAGRHVRFVWGNTDWPSGELSEGIERLGIPLPGEVPLLLKWGQRSIAVFHGHEKEFRRALTAQQTDYILYGHTHKKSDERHGRTRCINPGALHRAAIRTVATLDLSTDELNFLEVPR